MLARIVLGNRLDIDLWEFCPERLRSVNVLTLQGLEGLLRLWVIINLCLLQSYVSSNFCLDQIIVGSYLDWVELELRWLGSLADEIIVNSLIELCIIHWARDLVLDCNWPLLAIQFYVFLAHTIYVASLIRVALNDGQGSIPGHSSILNHLVTITAGKTSTDSLASILNIGCNWCGAWVLAHECMIAHISRIQCQILSGPIKIVLSNVALW